MFKSFKMMSSLTKTLTHQPKTLISCVSTQAQGKYETLAVSKPKPHVFHVELNRPDKLNAFNHSMWQELISCFSSLNDNPECRVVVLSAQGKHFTAGIDLKGMMEIGQEVMEIQDAARKAKFFSKMIKLYQNSVTSLETCVKPVISVVHSACVGAGVDLVSASDIRYCTEDAWYQIKEVDIGMAADVGTLQRFPKVIGNTSLARELIFTARKFDSKEAMDMGFVSKVFKDKSSALEASMQLAETIAKKSPVGVQASKQSIVYSQSRPNSDGLEHIHLLNQTMLQSEDFVTAAMAQAMKNDSPDFQNL